MTAGAPNWQQPIQPVIPQGGIQRQPLQPTSHSMAPVNQTGQYGIHQPNVIQDVDTQMNNPQIRQPSIAHRETPKGNVLRSESHRARVNDQIVRGPVHVRDLESSWDKPPVKNNRGSDGERVHGSQESYTTRKRHWSILRKNQPQNIIDTINIPTKKVKKDPKVNQTIDLTHEITTEIDNLIQNTSDSEIPNEVTNRSESMIVKPLIEVISETLEVEDTQVNISDNDTNKDCFLAIPPLKHNPPDQELSIEQKRTGE